MRTQDTITLALDKEKLEFDDCNRIKHFPVTIPYKGFEIVIRISPERSGNFELTHPNLAWLRVLDKRDSAPLNKDATDDIYSPDDFAGTSPEGTGVNLQKAFSWIDREVVLDSKIPKGFKRALSYEEKLMVVQMGIRVRSMLAMLCEYFETNWENFQAHAGCPFDDKLTDPARVIAAMYQIDKFQGVWFASKAQTPDETIRNWLFVYLLGVTTQYRVDSGYFHKSVVLNANVNMLHMRWAEQVIVAMNNDFRNKHYPIHKAIDMLPEFKLTKESQFMTTLTKEQLETELQRAYRCIQGLDNARIKGSAFNDVYHAPALGAAKRFVFEGELDGTVYFEGKDVSVLHEALKLPRSN